MKTPLFRLLLAVTLLAMAPVAAHCAEKSKPAEKKAEAQVEKTHWITNSSGVRHNSRCRYFQNSKGRMCTKDEGRACKICGG